jgi:hypothetical protein
MNKLIRQLNKTQTLADAREASVRNYVNYSNLTSEQAERRADKARQSGQTFQLNGRTYHLK